MIPRLCLTIFLASLVNTPVAEIITGQVIAVSDGDTLILMKDHQEFKIRLFEIDTPELDQPYGNEARLALSALVYGKSVAVTFVTMDDYGRIVGKVFLDNMDVNAEMIRQGHAWVFRKYAKDKSLYKLEYEARKNQLGIWALPHDQRIPPWIWRHRRH